MFLFPLKRRLLADPQFLPGAVPEGQVDGRGRARGGRGSRGGQGQQRGRGRGRGGTANAAEPNPETHSSEPRPPSPLPEPPSRTRSPSTESCLRQRLNEIATPSIEAPRAGPHSRERGRRSRSSPSPTWPGRPAHANNQRSAPTTADSAPQTADAPHEHDDDDEDNNEGSAPNQRGKDAKTFFKVQGTRRVCLFCE